MSDSKDVEKKDVDPELDDLLDSALQDMTKQPEQQAATAPADNMWSEEFIKEAAAQFESNMAAILGGFSGVPEDQISQEQIAQTFSKMAEAAAQVLQPAGAGAGGGEEAQARGAEVSAAISQTLQGLSAGADTLQAPLSDQDLANMFSNFNLNDTSQEGNMFVPFMQGMMQSLLSKEVLYPSLKELLDTYPDWLRDNKGKIDPAEYERFEQQQQLMARVCAELEPERDDDPDDVKKRRFQVVLDLMQKMQELGQPPTELVGDMAAPPEGFAPPPGQDPAQCSIV